jgi:osmotically-inducible protein OsmY
MQKRLTRIELEPEATMKTDFQIQQDIVEELKWNPQVTHTHLTAAVCDGVVTLGGNVPTYIEKMAAEEAAQKVSGVKAVANEIHVKLLGSFERTDEEIAHAAVSALRWNVMVPDNLKISVENGWIKLRGQVDWEFQRTAAVEAVTPLFGVRGVSNHIEITSKVQPSDIKHRIEAALKRTAEHDGHGIEVMVEGNRVVLSGMVRSIAEMEDARLAAWAAPGVITVENRLRVAA